MRKILIQVLLLILAGLCSAAPESTLSLPEETAKSEEVRKTPEKESQETRDSREDESEIDRILSGEETIPLVSEEELAQTLGQKVDAALDWFHRERHALFVLLTGAVLTIGIGIGLGIGMEFAVDRLGEPLLSYGMMALALVLIAWCGLRFRRMANKV